MHQATLVITDNFPTYQELNELMFPFGYPEYSEGGMNRHKDRFDLECLPNSQEIIDATLAQFSVAVKCMNMSQGLAADENALRNKYYDLWQGRGNELTDKVVVEEVLNGNTYQITIHRIYSSDLMAELKKERGIDGDFGFFSYADNLSPAATEGDIFEYMLTHGYTNIIHIVDNKPLLYSITGFEHKWDWWVIGGRWYGFIQCKINGEVNATACNSLDMERLTTGGLAYARDMISLLFDLTLSGWDRLHQYGDFFQPHQTFAMAVLEFLYIKKCIVEFNDADPLDYKKDYEGITLDVNLLSSKMKVIKEWVLETAQLRKVKSGELTMADINARLTLPKGSALDRLSRELHDTLKFTDSFFCSAKKVLDHNIIVNLTGQFDDYVKNMDLSTLGRMALLVDGTWYDSWDHSEYVSVNSQDVLHIRIDELLDEHQELFESLDKNSLYYTSMVELPEGRFIPWSMFIEFMLSHKRYKDKFVTVIDSHI